MQLKAGWYEFENTGERFNFTIGVDGALTDSAISVKKSNQFVTVYYLLNGKVLGSKAFTSGGKLIKKTNLKGATLITMEYDPNGAISRKTISVFDTINISNRSKDIRFEYDEKTGKVSFEQNDVQEYSKRYYKSGKVETFNDNKNKIYCNYNENGTIATRQFYQESEKLSCKEVYQNGKIVRKECTQLNFSQSTYTYKNGVLLYYDVLLFDGSKVKRYSAKNRLIGQSKPKAEPVMPTIQQ